MSAISQRSCLKKRDLHFTTLHHIQIELQLLLTAGISQTLISQNTLLTIYHYQVDWITLINLFEIHAVINCSLCGLARQDSFNFPTTQLSPKVTLCHGRWELSDKTSWASDCGNPDTHKDPCVLVCHTAIHFHIC